MVGILCEKPSAARNFAKALGGMRGKFNEEQYMIVNSVGHVYELKKPAEQVSADLQDKYKSWDINNLPWNETDFKWFYEKKEKTGDIIKSIKDGLSKCDEIVIATDVDPSGEGFLLAAEILLELKLDKKKISRMYFIDESEKEIRKAFLNRVIVSDIQKDKEYIMAYYRTRWDFISMQWTRMALAFSDGKSVLRQGRLKSAMVEIVGDQLKKIEEYKPIPFFQNQFKDENGVIYRSKDEPTYPTKEEVPKIYTDSPVKLDAKERKQSAPPKLLDLASLAARLAPKGFRSKEVLDTYQKMYESQVVSYPRTEDKTITPEQFNDLLPLVDKIASVVGVDTSLLTHRTARKTHVKTGGSHGANRPGSNVPDSLDSLNVYGRCAKDIYKVLALNYLAMLAEDYEYELQKAHVEKYPKFIGSAKVPKVMGWKQIFDTDDDKDEDENAKGVGSHAEPYIYEGVNPKPKTPTMKWLMAQLEKAGVGTGATRTSTYSEVTSEKAQFPLMKDTKGKISMTQYGSMSYELLPNTHIGDLSITKKVEEDMKAIAAGKASPEECLHNIQNLIRDDIVTMQENGGNMRKKLGVGAGNQEKEKYTGIWNGKEVSFNRVLSDYRFSDEECEALLAGNEIVVNGVTGKSGRKLNVKGHLEEQEYKGHSYVGFRATAFADNTDTGFEQPEKYTGKWKKKEVSFNRKFADYRFSDEECETLLAGNEISVYGVTGKSGNKLNVKGCLANQTYNGHKYVGFKVTGFIEDKASIKQTDIRCPRCGRIMEMTDRGLMCQGRDTEDKCAFSIGRIAGKDLSADELKTLIEEKKIGPLSGFKNKKGALFDASLVLSESEDKKKGYEVKFLFEEKKNAETDNIPDIYAKCPVCGAKMVKGRFGWECEKRCGVSVPYILCKRKMEPEVVEALLSHGSTNLLEGFVSKTGKEFVAGLEMKKGKIGFYFPKKN